MLAINCSRGAEVVNVPVPGIVPVGVPVCTVKL